LSANRLRSAKNCVLVVQPRGGNSSDEELKETRSHGFAKVEWEVKTELT
jgi:hypothetical protein